MSDPLSSIPIALDSTVYNRGGLVMDDSGRQSRVTLAPSVYNPDASRRDRRLPHIPTSPWPLPPPNQDALQEETSPPAVQDGPQRRVERWEAPRTAPAPRSATPHGERGVPPPRPTRSESALRDKTSADLLPSQRQAHSRTPSGKTRERSNSGSTADRQTPSRAPSRKGSSFDLGARPGTPARPPPPSRAGTSFDLFPQDRPNPPPRPTGTSFDLFPKDRQIHSNPATRKNSFGDPASPERQVRSNPVSRQSTISSNRSVLPPPPPPPIPPPPAARPPGPTYPTIKHSQSVSEVSTMSMESNRSNSSTQPLAPRRQWSDFPHHPSRQNSDPQNHHHHHQPRPAEHRHDLRPPRPPPPPRSASLPAAPVFSPAFPTPPPPLPQRSKTMEAAAQTQYMAMLLSVDKIPRLHNILVSCFTWILLAGFVVIPGSFNSLRRLEATTQGEVVPGSPAVNALLGSVAAGVSVTVVGFAFMLVGLAGACWLGWRWRRNYVWLLNKLYMPVLLNALAGVITTLVNVYAQQRGGWNPQAIVAITVEAAVLALSALLFGVYNFWLLERVKGRHDRTMVREGYGDRRSFMARVKEVKEKPSLAPGSVV